MPVINISIENKIAEADGTLYVCDNSDFVAKFAFDAEWEAYENKTARFCYNNSYVDVVFTGNECPVPIISGTYFFNIGVYAGNLRTTTPARVPCKKSILCGSESESSASQEVRNEFLDVLDKRTGDLADLTTEAKDTLVAAINEVARSSGSESMDLRVADGYIQYSTDSGSTWQNLIAVAELKGDKGDPGEKGDTGAQGAKGDPGATGADGITPHIGDNGNWYIGDTDTGNPSRGATGAKGDTGATGPVGPQGPAGTPGKDGAKGDPGAPGKDGAGMDITGATVGQIAKITAVDASGVPTAWEPVDMPSGGGGDFAWEKIADINVADDVANGVSAWEYTGLPGYDAIMYFKQSLKGENSSGISVSVNGGNSQPSGIAYNQGGYSCVGLIYLSPFGMLHLATGNANSPTNFSNGGMASMYCPVPADGDRITSIRLVPHTTYKIVSGKLTLYGGKHQ